MAPYAASLNRSVTQFTNDLNIPAYLPSFLMNSPDEKSGPTIFLPDDIYYIFSI